MKPVNGAGLPGEEHLPIPQTEAEFQQVLDRLFKKVRQSARRDSDLIPTALYERLSKVDPTQTQYSFSIQDNKAEEFACAHRLEIVARYADPDATGRHSRRPQWRKLIEGIKSGLFRAVLIHRVDRSFRNAGSFIMFLNLCARYGVRVLFIDEPFDSESPVGRMILVIVAILAEFFLRLTSQRVREMKEARYQRGLPNSSLSLGYCNGLCAHCTDPNGPGYCPLVGGPDRGAGRVWVPHPIEQHAVRLMAYLYHDGWSDQEIADYLNSHVFSLPTGPLVRFRTKGSPGKTSPGLFTADSVRIKVMNPFPAGYIGRYPSKGLDMEDDPEHPDRKPERPPQPTLNRRIPLQLIKGQHEALISFELWQQNQIIRQSKGRTSTSNSRPKRLNPYTSVARCWVCHSREGQEANLRASTGSSDCRGYGRCGRCQDAYRQRKRRLASAADLPLARLDLSAEPISRELAEQHRNIPLEKIEAGFLALLDRLSIPPEWHDLIIAYFLNDDGLLEYKRQTYELHQEMEQVRSLHNAQMLNRAQAQQKISRINAQLLRLQPAQHPAAALVLPLLQDFQKLWRQLEPLEQRSLLQVMFAGVYFDAQGEMQLILANSPFDTLLDVADDEPGVIPQTGRQRVQAEPDEP